MPSRGYTRLPTMFQAFPFSQHIPYQGELRQQQSGLGKALSDS